MATAPPITGAVAAPPQGGAYNSTQLQQLWIQNGGPPALAPLMAAIAMAESGGHPQSVNATDNNGTQTSWGLWQISDGTHNQPVANILDPNVNAQAAVAKYNSQGLGAWGTYTSGAYKQYLGGNAATLASSSSAGGSTGPCADPTSTSFELNRSAGCCDNVYLINASPSHFVTECQARRIAGVAMMGVGAVVLTLGVGIMLAATGAPRLLGATTKGLGVSGAAPSSPRATRRRMAEREHASGLRTQEAESKASARRYGSGSGRSLPGAADRERWGREGFPGDQAAG